MPVSNITIIVPLYNEAVVFPELKQRLDTLITATTQQVDILLVDDGSTDATAVLMDEAAANDPRYSCLFLSRNFGHSMAITAALEHISDTTDAVFIIDGDLQDPPELLSAFVSRMNEGYDVVYGVRNNRKEGILKKTAYKLYYRLQKRFSNTAMPLDAGDFSLISQRVVKHINRMPEQSRYIRGMRSWVGFKQAGIVYSRDERHSGKSKYSFWSLMKLAFNGIFNFSELPIRFIGFIGLLSVVLSLAYLGYTIYQKLVYGTVPQGFTALIFAIVLFSGVQLLSLGLIGEYVLRIFFQVKGRPLYIIKSKIIKGRRIDE